MNSLDKLIRNYEKNIEWIKENRNEDFIKGYLRAMKDAKWLKNKIDASIEKDIQSYFNAPDKDSWHYKRLQEIKLRKGDRNE